MRYFQFISVQESFKCSIEGHLQCFERHEKNLTILSRQIKNVVNPFEEEEREGESENLLERYKEEQMFTQNVRY